MRGCFVTIEGGEGVGKSTQAARVADHLRAAGVPVVLTRDPGGTPAGDRIRELLLDPEVPIDPRTEVLLYEASRAELVAKVIEPALAGGSVVVCDRFADSTIAYQAYGRGLDPAEIRALDRVSTGGLAPDVTVLLTLGLDESMARATRGGADRIERESLEFHRRVNDGFLAIAAAEPDRVLAIDAVGSIDTVDAAVWAALSSHPALRAALGRG